MLSNPVCKSKKAAEFYGQTESSFLHKENALTVRLSFFERGLSGKCALLVWIGCCSTTGIQVIIGSIARLQLVGAAVMIRSTTSEGVEAGDERRVVFEAAKNVIFMHQLCPINPFLQESFMIQGVPISSSQYSKAQNG